MVSYSCVAHSESFIARKEAVVKRIFNLAMEKEFKGYLLYKSKEKDAGESVINGVYIQRVQFDRQPPSLMRITLEWDEKPATQNQDTT